MATHTKLHCIAKFKLMSFDFWFIQREIYYMSCEPETFYVILSSVYFYFVFFTSVTQLSLFVDESLQRNGQSWLSGSDRSFYSIVLVTLTAPFHSEVITSAPGWQVLHRTHQHEVRYSRGLNHQFSSGCQASQFLNNNPRIQTHTHTHTPLSQLWLNIGV